MITHSLGELDVLFPLFAGVKAKHDVNVKIIFTVKQLHRQYELNDFYRYCVRELDIKVTRCQLPNKFDYRDGLFKTRIGALILKSYFGFLKIIKYPLLIPNLVWADAYMYETSNQKGSTFMLHWASIILPRNVFVYHHGHSLNQVSLNPRKVYQAGSRVFLSFSNLNKEWAESLGYTTQYVIGFPKFCKEWVNLIQQYDGSEHDRREKVVIYSREAGDTAYMDTEKYIMLLLESYRVIRRQLGNILVVVKPHPREDTRLIQEIITKNNFKNFVVSNEQAGVLAKYAIVTISFFTAAILDPLIMGVPSVEFYKEAKNFRLLNR